MRQRVEQFWQELLNRNLCYIECVCPDSALHRQRLETRQRDIPGWYEPGWTDVMKISETYKPCLENRLVLDARDNLNDNCSRALAHVSESGG